MPCPWAGIGGPHFCRTSLKYLQLSSAEFSSIIVPDAFKYPHLVSSSYRWRPSDSKPPIKSITFLNMIPDLFSNVVKIFFQRNQSRIARSSSFFSRAWFTNSVKTTAADKAKRKPYYLFENFDNKDILITEILWLIGEQKEIFTQPHDRSCHIFFKGRKGQW